MLVDPHTTPGHRTPRAEQDLRSGRLISGRYRLGDELGRGGFGVVYAANDELLGREVAVKEILLPPSISADERATLRARVLREARSAGRLHHPGLVPVFDVIDADDRPWIVMEFVDGASLSENIRESGPLPRERVARIGISLAYALEAAHRSGIVHRDVKPANVLIGTDGRVRLTDFGIALSAGDPTLTRSGVLLGSPSYIAPERARGGAGGPASDVWALGATLYTAVEGGSPYESESAIATLTAIVDGRRHPFRLAGALAPILDDLMASNPAARPPLARVRQRLREISERESSRRRGSEARGAGPARASRGKSRPGRAVEAGHAPETVDTPAGGAWVTDSRGSRPPEKTVGESPAGPDATPPPDALRAALDQSGTAQPATQAPAGSTLREKPGDQPRETSGDARSADGAAVPGRPAPTPSGPTPTPGRPTPTPGGPAPTPADTAEPPDPGSVPGSAKAGPTNRDRGTESPPGRGEPDGERVDVAPRPPAPATPEQSLREGSGTPGSWVHRHPRLVSPASLAQRLRHGTGAPAPRALVDLSPPNRLSAIRRRRDGGSLTTGQDLAVGTVRAAVPPVGTRGSAPVRTRPVRTWRSRRPLLIAVLVTLLAATAVVIVALRPTGRSDLASGQAASPAANAVDTAPPSAAAPPLSAPPARDTDPGLVPLDTTPVPPPSGWQPYRGASGWSVSYPAGWKVRPAAGAERIDFSDPETGAYLRIEAAVRANASAIADWQTHEGQLRLRLPDYRRVTIQPSDGGDGTVQADWEFTYTNGGKTIHVLNRGVVRNGHGYALYWSAPHSLWDSDRPLMWSLFSTFRPGP